MNAFPLFSAKGGGSNLLLDLFPGATVAYSVRKLRTAYAGSALKVVRSSDNATQDIGFVGQNLDTASLLAFAGAGNAFVIKWYDQSGNGNDLTNNSSPTGGITIVASGIAAVYPGTSIVCLSAGSATSRYFNFASPVSASGTWSNYCVGNRSTTASRFSTFFNSAESTTGAGTFNNNGTGTVAISDGSAFASVAYSTTGNMMSESYKISGNLSLTVKGVQIIAPTAGGAGTSFDQYGYGRTLSWTQKIAEQIHYASDQTSNASGIRANMVAYFGASI